MSAYKAYSTTYNAGYMARDADLGGGNPYQAHKSNLTAGLGLGAKKPLSSLAQIGMQQFTPRCIGTLGLGLSQAGMQEVTPRGGLVQAGTQQLTPRGINNSRLEASMEQLTSRGIDTHGAYGNLEETFKTWVSGQGHGKAALWKAWHSLDYNGNGRVSLAEIDKWVVENFRELNNKPALMRAYKASSAAEHDGFVHKMDFPVLLRNVIYFNKLWSVFEEGDDSDDRRMSLREFHTLLPKLGLSNEDAHTVFNQLDTNRGGLVLFDEFCKWVASVHCPVDSMVYEPMGTPVQHRHRGGHEEHERTPGRVGKRSSVGRGVGGTQMGNPTQNGRHLSAKFNEVETKFKTMLKNKKQLQGLWRRLDYNGNGIVSLAEIDKFVVEAFPVLDNKPALMRAYKATTRGGDEWVQKREFPGLLRNLLYFNKCWAAYEILDEDSDRRMDFDEFQRGIGQLGLTLGPAEAKEEFEFMDANGGGMILFDEFCKFVAAKQLPLE